MTFRFGEYSVDERARLVLRAGVVVHLSPKAFDLLVALFRERPRVLSKKDLHARLWPDTFVSDASLAMVVAELRAAIGESAREPRHVRTVHRHGYAFQDAASDGVPAGSPVSYWLVTEKGDLPLRSGENIVGRDPTARVWLDAPSVSRRHARIVVATDRVTLEDLGSKNGTFAGDVRVTTDVSLNDGHRLRFGSVAVVFRAWAADPTRTEGGGC